MTSNGFLWWVNSFMLAIILHVAAFSFALLPSATVSPAAANFQVEISETAFNGQKIVAKHIEPSPIEQNTDPLEDMQVFGSAVDETTARSRPVSQSDVIDLPTVPALPSLSAVQSSAVVEDITDQDFDRRSSAPIDADTVPGQLDEMVRAKSSSAVEEDAQLVKAEAEERQTLEPIRTPVQAASGISPPPAKAYSAASNEPRISAVRTVRPGSKPSIDGNSVESVADAGTQKSVVFASPEIKPVSGSTKTQSTTLLENEALKVPPVQGGVISPVENLSKKRLDQAHARDGEKNEQQTPETATKIAVLNQLEKQESRQIPSASQNPIKRLDVTEKLSLDSSKSRPVVRRTGASELLEYLSRNSMSGCAAVLPIIGSSDRVTLAGYANSEAIWAKFEDEITTNVSIPFKLGAARIANAQCRALIFAKSLSRFPVFSVRIDLDQTRIVTGTYLSGNISGSGLPHRSLLIVDDEGLVQPLNRFIKKKEGHKQPFQIPMSISGKAVETAQMLIALATTEPLSTVTKMRPTDIEVFFERLSEEITLKNINPDMAIAPFYVRSR